MTPAQLLVLKTAILAETDPTVVAARQTENAEQTIAAWYNTTATPTHLLWRTDASVNDINDSILWDRYTPSDTADGTATFTNRVLAIQVKQMNLQLLLQGRATLDATKPGVRAALRDATILIPSGVAGAAVSPGGSSGVTVLAQCTRPANRWEKVSAVTSATTGATTAFLPVYQGSITAQDVSDALRS